MAKASRLSVGYGRFKGTPDCKDRKSTRLNSSHANISYAVFCLKKKKYHVPILLNSLLLTLLPTLANPIETVFSLSRIFYYVFTDLVHDTSFFYSLPPSRTISFP